MKLSEAYQELNLPENATPEEAKKRYKTLTKTMHPDVNKAPDAEEKFKKINEAYACIQAGKSNEHEQYSNPIDFDFFGQKQRFVKIENVELHTAISFKEAVFGCKQDMKFQRKSKCHKCQGAGTFKLHNGCEKCKGQGNVTSQRGNVIFTQTCDKCWNKHPTEKCSDCQGTGSISTETSINISIPAGVQNNNILRLSGMGHFVGSNMFGEQYTDAFLHIKVIPEEGLSMLGENVVSILNISLLEALTGANKETKTLDGYKPVVINKLSKNKDEVIIPNLGVNRQGNHVVVLNVTYPENIEPLLQTLNSTK